MKVTDVRKSSIFFLYVMLGNKLAPLNVYGTMGQLHGGNSSGRVVQAAVQGKRVFAVGLGL